MKATDLGGNLLTPCIPSAAFCPIPPPVFHQITFHHKFNIFALKALSEPSLLYWYYIHWYSPFLNMYIYTHAHIYIYIWISNYHLSAFSALFTVGMLWGFLSHYLPPRFYCKCCFGLQFPKKTQQQNPWCLWHTKGLTNISLLLFSFCLNPSDTCLHIWIMSYLG